MSILSEKITRDIHEKIVEVAKQLAEKFRALYHPTYTGLFDDSVEAKFHVESNYIQPFRDGVDYRFTFAVTCGTDPHHDGYYVVFDLVDRTGEVVSSESVRLNPHWQIMSGSSLQINNRALGASIGQNVEYFEALEEILAYVTTYTLGTSIF